MPNRQPHSQLPAKPSRFLAAITPQRSRSWLTIAALAALLFSAQGLAVPITAQTPPQYMLVKLGSQAWQNPERTMSSYGLSNWERLRVPGWVRVTIPPKQEMAITALHGDPAVQAIEEDHRVQVHLTPDDTYWDNQWGPEMMSAPAAWDIQTGSPTTVVAVLDTGIDLDHPDLAGQLWVNSGEIPGNHQDDDGNGYVDDLHGWRFLHEEDGTPDQSPLIDDNNGHGTHVSGIIAARGNNGHGIAGIAWGSQVMVVKVLDQRGIGTYSDVAEGLIYAADNGAHVANLSLGGETSNTILQDAVNYAHAHGTLIVASAGNTSSAVQYPAACDNVLGIAASTLYDVRASYSCYGPEVDLTAPGSSILSTCEGGGYCYKSGTSMAAPHVAGLAALIYAERPIFGPDQVAQLLTETAQDLGSPGKDEYTGWGRIDAYRALVRLEAQFNSYLPIIQIDNREYAPLR